MKKSNLIVCAIASLSMGVASLAFAQDHRDDHGRGDQHHDDGNRGNRGGPAPRGDMHDRGPGAGPDHNFYRGGRLPAEYRNRQYVVDDWRGHHLTPPPRGYQWVQTGGDYVLAAIATGVIASILLNH